MVWWKRRRASACSVIFWAVLTGPPSQRSSRERTPTRGCRSPGRCSQRSRRPPSQSVGYHLAPSIIRLTAYLHASPVTKRLPIAKRLRTFCCQASGPAGIVILSRAEREPNVSHVTSITISPRRRSLAIICIRSKSLRLGYEPRDREG